jgi:hypothetical protein
MALLDGGMRVLDFDESLTKGERGEIIFKEDYLDVFNIKYEDVSKDPVYQKKGYDFKTNRGAYEVKNTWNGGQNIIIEEATDVLCEPERKGWIYTTEARVIAFIHEATRKMLLLHRSDLFMFHYGLIKDDYPVQLNEPSTRGDAVWQSSFRIVPIKSIEQYTKYYWYEKKARQIELIRRA